MRHCRGDIHYFKEDLNGLVNCYCGEIRGNAYCQACAQLLPYCTCQYGEDDYDDLFPMLDFVGDTIPVRRQLTLYEGSTPTAWVARSDTPGGKMGEDSEDENPSDLY